MTPLPRAAAPGVASSATYSRCCAGQGLGALAAPAGFRLAASSELVTGSALVGRAVLLRWPGPMAGFAGTALYGRGVLAFGPVRSAVGAGRCGGRLAARCRLARLGGPVDPALSAA